MKIAFISDIHEDVVSLRLALRKIEKLGCDEVICLGDISGFNARHQHFFDLRSASKCLKMVRENCSIVIAGNHDLHAARKIPVNSPGFTYPPNWHTLDFPTRQAYAENKVWLYDKDELPALYSNAEVDYIANLPEVKVKKYELFSVLLSHYIYPNITGNMALFYENEQEYRQHFEYMQSEKCRYSFAGHRHYAGLMVVRARQVIKKGFNRTVKLQDNNCVMIPSIVKNNFNNGFCIFDSDKQTVTAKRF